jgi:hypothetical protein
MRDHLDEGERFAWPPEIMAHGSALVALVEESWHTVPERRPTARALAQRLCAIAVDLSMEIHQGGP